MAENAFKADWPSFALGFNTGKSKGGSGGGMELNIAYGDAAPEDTTKLWVKCEKPSKVLMQPAGSFAWTKGVGTELGQSYLSNKLGTSPIGGASGVIGKKIYVFEPNMNIRCFDIESNAVSLLAEKQSVNRSYPGYATVGSKIYMFGGNKTSYNDRYDTIEVFNAETGKCEVLETVLPTAANDFAAVAVGSKIYLFGGAPKSGKLQSLWIFDTETNKIEDKGNVLPFGNSSMAACLFGNKIYLLGGTSSNGVVKTICVYNIETNSAETLTTSLPRNCYRAAWAKYGDGLIMVGGYSGGGSMSEVVYFDPSSETAIKVGEISGNTINGATAQVVDNTIYVLGGTKLSGNNHIYTFYLYGYTVAKDELAILITTNTPLLTIINASEVFLKIGVSGVRRGNDSNIGDRVELAYYSSGNWKTI